MKRCHSIYVTAKGETLHCVEKEGHHSAHYNGVGIWWPNKRGFPEGMTTHGFWWWMTLLGWLLGAFSFIAALIYVLRR